jgi:hypothetical protein
MRPYLLIATLTLTVLPSAAFAAGHYGYGGQYSSQRGTPEQQRACRPDVLRHCRGMHEDYAIEQCLRSNMSGLRPACRRVFQGG